MGLSKGKSNSDQDQVEIYKDYRILSDDKIGVIQGSKDFPRIWLGIQRSTYSSENHKGNIQGAHVFLFFFGGGGGGGGIRLVLSKSHWNFMGIRL